MVGEVQSDRKPTRRSAWLLGSALLIAIAALLFAQRPEKPNPPDPLAAQVARLETELLALRQERSMPVTVLNQHRASIGYVHGVYSYTGPEAVVGKRRPARTRFSGTAFVVAEGLMATNRHVAEPWFEDEEAERLMRRGARPKLEKLVAFFPGQKRGVEVRQVSVSADDDLAVLRFDPSRTETPLAPLRLAQSPGVPGDPVVVVGYPMGTAAMVAKSPRPIYRRLARRTDEMAVASELALLSLIRPSATFGHLGDVVNEKLIYDAVTAHGGSGGPVFNARGEVVGVNTAYLDGFSGSTLGVSVTALRPLVEAAQQP
ncbi:MAG: serine protease [Acidobacteria bacterium]|nr:serine protease [Acidobacteriota bacterium]